MGKKTNLHLFLFYSTNILDSLQVNADFGVSSIWVYVLNLPFNSSAILSQLLNYSDSQFSHLYNGVMLLASLTVFEIQVNITGYEQ